jgi:hypothetical protein
MSRKARRSTGLLVKRGGFDKLVQLGVAFRVADNQRPLAAAEFEIVVVGKAFRFAGHHVKRQVRRYLLLGKVVDEIHAHLMIRVIEPVFRRSSDIAEIKFAHMLDEHAVDLGIDQ